MIVYKHVYSNQWIGLTKHILYDDLDWRFDSFFYKRCTKLQILKISKEEYSTYDEFSKKPLYLRKDL